MLAPLRHPQRAIGKYKRRISSYFSSLREAKRRSNPFAPQNKAGLLRSARNDGGENPLQGQFRLAPCVAAGGGGRRRGRGAGQTPAEPDRRPRNPPGHKTGGGAGGGPSLRRRAQPP